MKFVWAVVLVFAGRFAVMAIAYPPLDGDLGWQRWLGGQILHTHAIPRALGAETLSGSGSSWVPQEWLFAIGATLGRTGFAAGVFGFLAAGCAIGALVLVAMRALRRGAAPFPTALAVAFAGIGLVESFGVRAQVVAWPFVAAFLLLLDIEGPWGWALVPLAALWSNLHASAMLAPAIAGVAALGVVCEERRWNKRVARSVALTAATAGAICLNPFGLDLPRYALMLFSSPIKHYISEWKVTDLGDTSFAFGALPLLIGALVFGAGARERRWKDAFVFTAFAFLLLSAARNMAIFGLEAAPLVALGLTRFWPVAQEGAPTQLDRTMDFALPAFAFVLSAVVAMQLVRNVPDDADRNLPTAALAALARMPGEHRLFCADFAWCSLVLSPDGGVPRDRGFLDGRADPFPLPVWNDFLAVAHVEPAWRTRLDANRIDTVLVATDAPLERALALAPGWHQAYRDKRFRLFMRAGRS